MTKLAKKFWKLGPQITGKCISNTLSDRFWVKVSRWIEWKIFQVIFKKDNEKIEFHDSVQDWVFTTVYFKSLPLIWKRGVKISVKMTGMPYSRFVCRRGNFFKFLKLQKTIITCFFNKKHFYIHQQAEIQIKYQSVDVCKSVAKKKHAIFCSLLTMMKQLSFLHLFNCVYPIFHRNNIAKKDLENVWELQYRRTCLYNQGVQTFCTLWLQNIILQSECNFTSKKVSPASIKKTL